MLIKVANLILPEGNFTGVALCRIEVNKSFGDRPERTHQLCDPEQFNYP
jgi:hypothetical protein